MMGYGLALSGGALRGAIHIGILETLVREGLPPKMITGTSAGSIVGCLYGAGVAPKEMERIFYRLLPSISQETEPTIQPLQAKEEQAITWLPLPKGLLNANFIETLLIKLVGRIGFDELSLPLAITATDLHTGEQIIFTGEKSIPPKPWPKNTVFVSGVAIPAAVRASCSIPGIFTPKEIQGRTLLDGGLVNNVPADILQLMGAEKIIAVDLGFGVESAKSRKNILEILLQTYDIMGQRIANLITAEYANLVLRPQGVSANLIDFHKIPKFMEIGRVMAQDNLNQIKGIIAK